MVGRKKKCGRFLFLPNFDFGWRKIFGWMVDAKNNLTRSTDSTQFGWLVDRPSTAAHQLAARALVYFGKYDSRATGDDIFSSFSATVIIIHSFLSTSRLHTQHPVFRPWFASIQQDEKRQCFIFQHKWIHIETSGRCVRWK